MTDNSNHGWTKDLNAQIKYPFFTFFKKTIIERDDGIAYLIRVTLISIGKWFSIKLHNILQSDDACLHDHPWPFISIILRGGYYEWAYITGKEIPVDIEPNDADYQLAPDGRWLKRTWYGPGSILIRPADFAHKLELPVWDGIPLGCKTLIFTGKVMRKRGFFTPTGWIYWRNYSRKENC